MHTVIRFAILLVCCAFLQSIAMAQGTLINGDNATGAISGAGEVDTWTFDANAGDAISLAIGEVTDNNVFTPWIRLRSPDSTQIGSGFGALAGYINVASAPLTGTYTVLVASADSGGTGTGTYRLRLAKTPGAFIVPQGDEGGPMTNGGNHTGTIDLGDLDMWTFQANAGDAISLAIGELTDNNVFTPWIRLRGPDGTQLGSGFGALAAYINVASAPLTGTYTVLVATADSSGSGTGTYRLTLAKTPGAFIVPAGDEGGPMTNGENHTGTIELGDLDMWTFQANAGDAISLAIGELTDNNVFTPWIRLRGPDGTQLGSGFGALAAYINVASAPLTGTYTVLVATADSSGTGTGTYRLTLAKTPGAFIVPQGDEGGPMTNGANHAGAIQLGDLDMWTFQANAGDAISLAIAEITDNNVFTPWIRLRGPDGSQLGSGFGALTGYINIASAPLTGTYTVLVATADSSGSGTGTYRLTLAKTPGAFIVPGGDEGGPMTNGANHTGTIDLGDLDMWTFQANAGDAISLAIGELTDNNVFTPWIRLRGPDGTQLGSGFGALAAYINVASAPLTGTYTVLVATADSSGTGTGTYRLTLAKTPGVFVVPSGDEGGPLSVGSNNNGRIHLGDLDQWTLQANAGETITLSISEVVDNDHFAPWIRLRGPTGAQLGSSFGATSAQINVTAPSTGTYTLLVATADSSGTGTGTYQITSSHGGAAANAGLRFVPVTPCRVVDTRLPNGPFGGPVIAANSTRNFSISAGPCGIPSTAQAYALNVTVVPTTGKLTYLTIWPTGQPQPLVSTLNSLDGRIKANAAIVAAGAGGAVSVYVYDESHVILDINGYFAPPASAPAGLVFYPVPPCRVMDTRQADGPLGGPIIAAGATRTVPILSSSCGLPNTAVAYSLNMTVVPTGPLNWLTTWPTGIAQPLVSTLNDPTGTVVANAAIVPAGTSGSINLYVTDQTHVIIDVSGYFAPPGSGGLQFYTVTPCRVVDTRDPSGPFGGPALNGYRDFNLAAWSCVSSPTVQAYSLSATVVPSGYLGYLTLWPTGPSQPYVSTLNSLDGSIVSNGAIVVSTNGSISAFSTDTTELILDLNGFFAP